MYRGALRRRDDGGGGGERWRLEGGSLDPRDARDRRNTKRLLADRQCRQRGMQLITYLPHRRGREAMSDNTPGRASNALKAGIWGGEGVGNGRTGAAGLQGEGGLPGMVAAWVVSRL